MTPDLHLWLIPLLPLMGAAINGLLGKRFSRPVVSAVALIFSGAALAQAAWIVSQYSSLSLPYLQTVAPWLRASSFEVDFAFYLDQLSLIMLMVVTGVGFLIHIYSIGYMWEDASFYRFFTYLNLFMFFMLTLVLASNYLIMFIGWEGVGLSSYLLIGFWFTKDSAAAAGKKAFIVNRVGDFGFLIALFLIIKTFGTLDFTQLFHAVAPLGIESGGVGVLTAIGILLMVGAAGKSAQIPLYIWLPDAMEGPTPVSALIHAATMVTAGVYMVSRSHTIFERAPIALMVVAIIGTLTAFFAATIGVTQMDIKKVLAYSTVSQLGYMFMACGVGAFSMGVFHLMTHAFFKGLLFLAAGSVIHAVGGEQDMRKMGGLRSKIPWTFWTMTVGTFAIAGIWPLAGFYSKDAILFRALTSPYGSWIYWAVGLLTAFITSFYMFRQWFMTFFGEYRGQADGGHGSHSSAGHGHGDHGHGHSGVHESPMVMIVPLIILAILSFTGGWVGSERFDRFLAPVFHSANDAPAEILIASEGGADKAGPSESTLAIVSVGVALFGLFLAWLLYVKSPNLPQQIAASMTGLYRTVSHKYYIDELYGWILVKPLVAISRDVLWQGVDRGVIDATLDGSAEGANDVSDTVRHMQSGNLRSYAGWIAAGAGVLIFFMVWLGTR